MNLLSNKWEIVLNIINFSGRPVPRAGGDVTVTTLSVAYALRQRPRRRRALSEIKTCYAIGLGARHVFWSA